MRLSFPLRPSHPPQVDLFFQDPASTRNPSQSQLFGRVSLLQVLRKRVDALGADEGGGDLSPEPFALESALATLALSILKRSSGSKQKEFADKRGRVTCARGKGEGEGDREMEREMERDMRTGIGKVTCGQG